MPPQLTPQTAQRNLKVIHAVFVLAAVSVVLVGEVVGPSEPEDITMFKYILAAVVILDVILIFLFLRPRWLGAARRELERDPASQKGLQDWMKASVISFVICETIVLFGLVLRALGGLLVDVAPFHLAGGFLLVVLSPRGELPGSHPHG
jgi:hypothetical protein